MYEKIKETLNEYEVVINRWPQYSLILENVKVSNFIYYNTANFRSVTVTPLLDFCCKLISSGLLILGKGCCFPLQAVANVERAVMKALEKQYIDILTPLKGTIQKKLGMHVQKLTRRQSTTLYSVPNQVSIYSVPNLFEYQFAKS